jgi:hypothetical protein
MLIRGHVNNLCGETPTDLRMGILTPTTIFVGLTVTLIETRVKLQLTPVTNHVVTHVSWRASSSHNLNASPCLE